MKETVSESENKEETYCLCQDTHLPTAMLEPFWKSTIP